MSREELLQNMCKLQEAVSSLGMAVGSPGPGRWTMTRAASAVCVQLEKERKVSSAYADELRRTREQNLAVVSAGWHLLGGWLRARHLMLSCLFAAL
jgi:hypothetical protein